MTHPIPLEVTLQHLAIVGRTGAGKTYTAKGLVEQLLDVGRRVVVLDPTGAWWGLRSLADGSPGFALPVIGGEHANVPLHVESAQALADWLTEKPRSAVIDLSELLIGERHRFVEKFADELYRANRTPLHLIIDEADEFAPQNPLPETKRMLHHVDRIVRRGRIRGFRVMLITQRPAVLHKNVLTQVNALVTLRLTAPQDRKAIEAWVEGNGDAKAARQVLDSLASLKRGEGWVWAPERGMLERTPFPAIRTFDSSRSPEDGDVPPAPREASVDEAELDQLRNLLDAPDADEPGETVEELRAEISRLQRQLTAPPAPAMDAVKNAYDRGRADGYSDGFAEGIALAERSVQRAFDAVRIASKADDSTPLPSEDPPAPVVTVCPPTAVANPDTARALGEMADAAARKVARLGGASKRDAAPRATLSKAERAILNVLAQYPGGRTKVQIALLTGYAHSGGGFNNAISALRTRRLLEGTPERLLITEAGSHAAGPVTPLPRGRALLDHWLGQLGRAERVILLALASSYPRPLTKEKLARETQYEANGGGFNNALSRLRTLELVQGRGELKASDDLFGGSR